MSLINTIIGTPLGYLMWLCYNSVHDYALAIIIFTLLTKVILLPVAIKVQKNSIKMVEMQPKLNEIAATFAGDKDQIADEQIKLYDQEKYSPAAGCLPMLIQIPIILGLIQVIYNPLQHLLHISQGTIQALIAKTSQLTGFESGASPQIHVVEAVQNPAYADSFRELQATLPGENVVAAIQSLDMSFFGLNLAGTPSIFHFNNLWLIPALAGITALALCLIQNKINVLQVEQGLKGQWSMTIFLTIFSLYFTFIVPAGVGLYWIFSNFFSILQLFLLNHLYDPKKYIDYEALEQSKIKLAKSKARMKAGKKKSMGLFFNNPYRKREAADYKRFFATEDKQLVFYSEKSGFYKYFENVIDEIIANSEIIIHYVTSDPDDAIFKKNEPRIVPYYIGEKRLIPFMMKMDADMVVMTMPDLEQFHIKRSLVRKDVEYVYMFHAPLSTHMIYRQAAFNAYDIIFCVGPHQANEIREMEKLHALKEKTLIECGYGVIENLYAKYQEQPLEHEVKKILIAPSWQEDNILDSCIHAILEHLLGQGYQITIRPHPEYVKRYSGMMDQIIQKYQDYSGNDLSFDLDFSSSDSIFHSDILITDWSGTAYEFSFATGKPTLFINTPMKIMNEKYLELSIEPMEVITRSEIGVSLDPDAIDNILPTVQDLLARQEDYKMIMEQLLPDYLFNFGQSGMTGSKYIIEHLQSEGKQALRRAYQLGE